MVGNYLSVVLLAFLFTIPLSYILVWRFKIAVEKRINSHQDFQSPQREIFYIQPKVSAPELKVIPLKNGKNPKNPFLYFFPFFLSAFVLSVFIALTIYWINPDDFSWLNSSILFLFMMSPVFLIGFLFSNYSAFYRNRILKLGAFFYAMILVFAVFISDKLNLFDAVFGLFFIFGLVPLLFFLLYLFRSIQSIVFVVFPAIFIAISTLTFLANDFQGNEESVRVVFNFLYEILKLFGWVDFTRFVLYFMVLLFVGILAILFSGIVRSQYRNKRYNNFLFLTDMIWISQITYVILSFQEIPFQILVIPVLFFLYKLVFWIGLNLFHSDKKENKRLLVLRVFSLGRKSEKFFQKLKNFWAYNGSIQLISGYDLTTSIMDIDDLLVFYSGQIKNRFNLSNSLIQQNISKLDFKTDFDRRFRINKMYSNNSTWKTVLHELIDRTDYALMDIRNFHRKNAGCAYEIQALVHFIPLEKTCFIINESTDVSFVQEIVESAWKEIPIDSPNASNPQPIRLFKIGNQTDFDTVSAYLELELG